MTIHVVLQIEHAWETGACDLLFIPRSIGFLRIQQVTQTSLNARPIEIAARADAHDCPCRLRRRAFANALGRWIFVGAASLTPTAVVILTAFKPIAAAQYPILGHVLANRAQAAQNLPGAVDVIDAPASIPRAVLVLSVDQILDGVADGSRLRIEPNVTEQLECACGKVTACWIENRIVIGKRHVFQPWGGDILIKRSPTAIATLETELPIQCASKCFVERLRIFRTNQPQRH